MSTRSTTHFVYGNEKHPLAIVYRHSDGYPEVAGVELRRFFEECAKLPDPRLGDPTYLAAKYVVFLADTFNVGYERNRKTGAYENVRKANKLDFLSVGVVQSDPGDIEYRYVVDCKVTEGGRPTLKCYKVSNTWDSERQRDIPPKRWTLTEVSVPVFAEVA